MSPLTTAAVAREAGTPGLVVDNATVPVFAWPLAVVDPVLAFVTYGVPAPQGSKKIVTRGGRAAVKEVSDHLGPWRDAVRAMAKKAIKDWEKTHGQHWYALDEPVLVQAVITMPSSAAAAREGRVFHTGTPDTDKLERAIGDALSPTPPKPSLLKGLPPNHAKAARAELMERQRRTCVLHDDSRVVAWDARKVYPGTTVDSLAHPGALIRVWKVADLL